MTIAKDTIVSENQNIGFIEFITLMALISSLVALSIDAMLPALSEIGLELKASEPHQAQLIISMLILGMSIGQLVFGPMADALGRKLTIQTGLVFFSLGSILCLFANSMSMMIAGRILQGFGVAGPRIASLALIRDKYQGDAMARVMSFIMMVFILVPMIAPLIGQGILWLADWRSIFVFILGIGVIVSIWLGIRQEETLVIEKRRSFSWKNLIAASWFVLSHRQVMGYTLGAGFLFGAFLTYLSSSQTIFQHIYQVGSMFPLYFAILAFSIGTASFINGKLVLRLGMHRLCQVALSGLVLIASVLCLIIGFSLTLPPIELFMALMMLMFFCVGILFGNINSLAMQPLIEFAGLGAAMIGSISNLIAVLIATFVGRFIVDDLLALPLGFLCCGVLTLVFFKQASSRS